jgi:hypothetical protein
MRIGMPRTPGMQVKKHLGSANYGVDWAAIGTAVGNVVSSIKTWAEENPEQAEAAVSATLSLAAESKKDGEDTIEASKSVSNVREAKIMKYIGEYRIKVGSLQTQLVRQGIITQKSQAVSIRNMLADELYTSVFTDSDQKATLIYIIDRIDDSY